MKRFLFAVPVIALIAAGCNSSQQVSSHSPAPTPSSTVVPTSTLSPSPTVLANPTAVWKKYTNSTYGFEFQYPEQYYLYGRFLSASGKYSSEQNDPAMESLDAGLTLVGTPYLTVQVTSLGGLPTTRGGGPDPVDQQDLVNEKTGLEKTPVGGSFADSDNTDPSSDIGKKVYEVIIPTQQEKIDVFVAHAAQAPGVALELVTFNNQGDKIEVSGGESDLNSLYMKNLETGPNVELTDGQVEASPDWQTFLSIARSFQFVSAGGAQ